jgi:MarR family transcriptional regulator for hemolysin
MSDYISRDPPKLGFLLHEVARLQRRRFEQRARVEGLTRSQFQAIAYLSRHEGIHQAALAELLEVEPISLVRILDKLAERGLIERRQHPTDRRSWLLFLKDDARPLLAAMECVGDVTRAEALEGVSSEDQNSLMRTLSRMKTNLIAACRARAENKEVHHG